MQDAQHGVPVRSQKLFLTSIPAAFMGKSSSCFKASFSIFRSGPYVRPYRNVYILSLVKACYDVRVMASILNKAGEKGGGCSASYYLFLMYLLLLLRLSIKDNAAISFLP